MAEHSNEYEMGSAETLRKKYGLNAESRPTISLNSENIPQQLHALIPWAERFGISDDLIRDDVICKTAKEELMELHRLVRQFDDQLDEWLAGPAATGPTFSDAYIAFSAMRMAADSV